MFVLAASAVFCVAQAPSAFSATNDSELCNDGTTSLYFATVGEFGGLGGLLRSSAMVQGLVEIPPKGCRDLVPNGMNKVILTFFQKDNRGIFTNLAILPKNVTRVSTDIQHVCVNLQQPYRIFGTPELIRRTYVNAQCPQGFSPAVPAWIHQPGGLTEYHVSVHANKAAKPWRDSAGQQYQSIAALRVPPVSSAGPLVQANPMALADRKATNALLRAGRAYAEHAEAKAQQERARRAGIQQQRRTRYSAQVSAATQSLERPSDAACAAYAPKDEYRRAEDVAVSGVSLGMDLANAHQALICNGFTINPQLLARAGGVEKFWAIPRVKTFHKQLDDGTVVRTEVEVQQPRGAPRGTKAVVSSVRARYQHARPLSKKDWKLIRQSFKKRYPVGRRKQESPAGVLGQFRGPQRMHLLQLNAEDLRGDSLSRYNMTIY